MTLPQGACFTMNGIVQIDSTTGLTINGNGATLEQTIAGKNGGTDETECGHHPMLFLTESTNLAISDLKLVGAFDGTNGGSHTVRVTPGVELQGDSGVTLTGLSVSEIQGDGFSLQPNYVGEHGPNQNLLNTNVVVTDSTWHGIGYDCISMEAAYNVKVSGDTFSSCHENAIDFEYDLYSTFFKCPTCPPLQAAQDNVAFTGDTFRNWGPDFFASLQGQYRGVQRAEHHLLRRHLPTPMGGDAARRYRPVHHRAALSNIGLTFTGNTFTGGVHSTSGGAPNVPNVGATITMLHLNDVTITDNIFPVWYERVYGPYLAVIKANGVNGLTGHRQPLPRGLRRPPSLVGG